jgi:beta-mannanase
MSGNRQIIEAVQRMTGTQLSDSVKVLAATVDTVDEARRTCTVTTVSSQGSVTIENVQLMASIDDGILMVPAVDSTVIIAYSTFNQPFVVLFSGLEKVLIVGGENNASVQIDGDGLILEIADTKLTIEDGKMTLNDGAMGGLVKVIELTQKLNALENKVNSLLAAYNAHVHSGVTTGPGSSGPTPSQVTGTLTPTQRADIENDKIVQG